MPEFTQELVIALLQIIAIDILLGGDNAIVIALASRSLPPAQQRQAILWGTGGAIVARAVLTVFAVYLLGLPLLKLIGGALLLWIGVRLLLPEQGDGHGVDASASLGVAIKTIVMADVVMSLDNVLAVAAAAKGSVGLVVFGLLVSIPIVIYGSTLVLKLMDRFPAIITLGGALLGYIAGDMMARDVVVAPWLAAQLPWAGQVAPWLGAAGVVALGKWLAARRAPAPPVVELAEIKSSVEER